VNATTVRLDWSAPYAAPDGLLESVRRYRVWVRQKAEEPFALLGELNGNVLAYLHRSAAAPALQYEVTAVWGP
jgi:hypothetical protein